jgi:hypothetical protein
VASFDDGNVDEIKKWLIETLDTLKKILSVE